MSWHQDNKLKANSVNRARRKRNPEKKMFFSARGRAKENDLAFNITLEDIVIPSHCPILGIPLFHTPYKRTTNSPALDRIINHRGYVKGNVQVISSKANSCKSDLTLQQVETLYLYMKEADDKYQERKAIKELKHL